MKAWEIVGYTADADVWCRDCIRGAYYVDDWNEGTAPAPVDSEGNDVHVIFASDEWEDDVCGRCLTPLAALV